MKKNKKISLIIKTIFLAISFAALYAPRFTLPAFAADVTTSSAFGTFRIGEEFAVPIRIASDAGHPINSFDFDVSYPENLVDFVGSDDTGSVVSLFVARPSAQGGHIALSGIIIGGFSDVFDPLTRQHSPGIITTLIFRPAVSGAGAVTLLNPLLYQNDGKGTAIASTGFSFPFNIKEETAALPYQYNDTTPPDTFAITLEKNPDIFSGKYFIVFEAVDKGSGISYYEVREGLGGWRKATSPYLLIDQSLQENVIVRAYDKAGNFTSVTLPAKIQFQGRPYAYLFIFLGLILLIFFALFKRKKKKIQKGEALDTDKGGKL